MLSTDTEIAADCDTSTLATTNKFGNAEDQSALRCLVPNLLETEGVLFRLGPHPDRHPSAFTNVALWARVNWRTVPGGSSSSTFHGPHARGRFCVDGILGKT